MKRSPSRFLYSTRTSSWPLPAFFTPPNLTSSSLAFLPLCRKLSSVKPPTPSQSASTICFLPALPLPAPLLRGAWRRPAARPLVQHRRCARTPSRLLCGAGCRCCCSVGTCEVKGRPRAPRACVR